MARRRRPLLAAVAAAAAALAGCGGGGTTAASTPPPSTFEIVAVGADAVELRYTGIGGQTTANFRVVLSGGGAADGTYDLAAVTDDDRWTEDDRYVLNRTTLGLAAPLEVEGLTVELQYNDGGTWRTLRRVQPAD